MAADHRDLFQEGEQIEIPPFGVFTVGKISEKGIELKVPKDDPRYGKVPIDLWLGRPY